MFEVDKQQTTTLPQKGFEALSNSCKIPTHRKMLRNVFQS